MPADGSNQGPTAVTAGAAPGAQTRHPPLDPAQQVLEEYQARQLGARRPAAAGAPGGRRSAVQLATLPQLAVGEAARRHASGCITERCHWEAGGGVSGVKDGSMTERIFTGGGRKGSLYAAGIGARSGECGDAGVVSRNSNSGRGIFSPMNGWTPLVTDTPGPQRPATKTPDKDAVAWLRRSASAGQGPDDLVRRCDVWSVEMGLVVS